MLGRLARSSLQVLRNKGGQQNQLQKRFFGDDTWTYRGWDPRQSRQSKWSAMFLSTYWWFWFTYHCYYQPDVLLGHPLPDSYSWTDEELGIPPDDED